MRSLMIRFSAAVVFRCVAVTLITLGCMCLFSACHRKDAGYEFRAAAAKGDLTKVQALLRGRPNLVFSKNKKGSTALHWAAAYDHKDVAEFLLSNKADVNAKTDEGSTPLHRAAYGDHLDLAELLLTHKADVNAIDKYGNTPLHSAVSQDHKDMAELLLTNGADVNAKAHKGTTPLQWVLGWLLPDKFGVNTKTGKGTTPLHWAAIKDYKDMAELMLANGAEVNAM